MSEDCYYELAGYGPSGSAIVGGIPRDSGMAVLPPPPPPPPPVAKSRPLMPHPPASAPPDDLLCKDEHEVEPVEDLDEIKQEPLDDEWTFAADRDPPTLSAPDRPFFIACLKQWLELNLSKSELQTLND